MSWISTLCATYDNCAKLIGSIPDGDSPYKALLPLAHTIKLAQLELTINRKAELTDAAVLLDKAKEQPTITPCSADAAARTSFNKPYALFDQIKYVAGDYIAYGGDVKFSDCHGCYMEQLDAWCASAYANEKVTLVRDYLRKNNVITDLVAMKLLFLADDGTVMTKWSGTTEDKPPFFRLGVTDLSGLLVRFRVSAGTGESRLWLDRDIWKSYSDYYMSTLEDTGICYVSGRRMHTTRNHPKFLRSNRDGAKLISTQQNESPFATKYIGSFCDVGEVVSVGYETSAKAHEALRWLIARQGAQVGDYASPLVYIAWSSSGEDVGRVTDDTFDLVGEEILAESYAKDFAAALDGYMSRKSSLAKDAFIVVMGLDSAVPGRLSIVYYREIAGSELKSRIYAWHTGCAWRQIKYLRPGGDGGETETSGATEIPDEEGKSSEGNASVPEDKRNIAEKKSKAISYTGAPSPLTMITAAYGVKCDKMYKKSAMKRLVPCIYDSAPIPDDMLRAAVLRMSQRTALENWEFRQGLGAVCAMLRKTERDKKGKVWNMALDLNERDRSYLFGRLLACVENAERRAMYVAGDKSKQTNAERYQHQFTLKPVETYMVLRERLTPYLEKLNPTEKSFTKREMNEIYDKIDKDAPDYREKLDGIYLLGYSSQMMQFDENIKSAKIRKEMIKLGYASDEISFAAGGSPVDAERLEGARAAYAELVKKAGGSDDATVETDETIHNEEEN